jgi:predicted nucleic acid-binding protein
LSPCVLDTDVVIAALDRRDAHHQAAAGAVRRLAETDTDLLLSAVNYAESLVRPAEDERTLRAAVDAIASLRIRVVSPDATVARNAAKNRGLGISLADGFALATAAAHDATVASFDKRVRRALRPAGLRLCPALGSRRLH